MRYQLRFFGEITETDNFLEALRKLQFGAAEKVSWDHEGGRLILRDGGEFEFLHPVLLSEAGEKSQ